MDDAADSLSVGDRDISEGVENTLEAVARKPTGPQNALFQQIQNEERKLAKRLEAVERMRELAEQASDEDMLQAAERLEQWATSHFDQRMVRITDFQSRHDLSDVGRNLSP